MIESPLLLTAVIAAATALAFLLDHKIAPLSKLGASLLAILFGAILSNLGIVTAASPIYGTISGSVTSLAIAWLLLAVNLADLKKAGRRMVGAFVLAVTGTALGAFVGALIFAGRFEAETWKLAGTLTGTYSGGGVNFVAVGRGLGLPEVLFAGATAADNAMTAIWLGVNLVLPLWLIRFYPTPIPGQAKGPKPRWTTPSSRGLRCRPWISPRSWRWASSCSWRPIGWELCYRPFRRFCGSRRSRS